MTLKRGWRLRTEKASGAVEGGDHQLFGRAHPGGEEVKKGHNPREIPRKGKKGET